MKLNEQFVIYNTDAETLLVPTANAAFHGLVQGNKTIGDILECLLEDTTEDKIVETLCSRYHGKREDMQADVALVIARLKEIGAINE